ncbi:Ribosome-inactivating protein [Ophiocordyceps camponoti-floridani]|uniref:Ribosome-inactivating protein n=1 Tax=Ophiocordyceps camponoti-floridani TaxID=2030778 RepID=A0A8H4Q330_9HYPO|nr:Ribosome-inactivating protein [Ophiocordyceps camponoti-floridani]
MASSRCSILLSWITLSLLQWPTRAEWPSQMERPIDAATEPAPQQPAPLVVYLTQAFTSNHTPALFQARGGIEDADGSDWVLVASDVETVWQRRARHMTSTDYWLFRIMATPNMLATEGQSNGLYAAFGGILWSSVEAYTAVENSVWQDRTPLVHELEWQLNPNYDARWTVFGPNVEQRCRVDGSGYRVESSLRTFMNEMTSRPSSRLDDSQLAVLRDLFDWDTRREPSRDLPLIRNRSPSSLLSTSWSTVRNFDWSNMGFSFLLRQVLANGIPTMDQCALVLRAYRDGVRRNQKRGVGATDCDILAAAVQADSEGRPMVQIHSVVVKYIDGEAPGELYGYINATDMLGTQDLYRVDRANAESVYPGQTLVLTGLERPIEATKDFFIDMNLWDRDFISPDDQVSRARLHWNASHPPETLDRSTAFRYRGRYGLSILRMTVFSKAVGARIEVVMINGDNEEPADVYGTIVVKSGPVRQTFFSRESDDHVDVYPGQKIPLEHKFFVLQTREVMEVSVDLWDHDALVSPDDLIASGTVRFRPRLRGEEKQKVNATYGEFEVRVTWF